MTSRWELRLKTKEMFYRVRLQGGVWIIESSNIRGEIHHYRAAKWQTKYAVGVVVGKRINFEKMFS